MQSAPGKVVSEDVESLFDFLEDDQQADRPSGEDARGQKSLGEQRNASRESQGKGRSASSANESETPLPIIRKPVCVSRSGPLTPPKPGDPVEPPPPLTDSMGLTDTRSTVGQNAEPDFSDLDDFSAIGNKRSGQIDDWPSSDVWVDNNDRSRAVSHEEYGSGGTTRILGYTLGVLLTAGGVSSALYSVTPVRQWVNDVLAGQQGQSNVSAGQNLPAAIETESALVIPAGDARGVGGDENYVGAPGSLNARFRQTLVSLEQLMEQGAFREAEVMLSTMDLAIYGYGAPEFRVIEERIAAQLDRSAEEVVVANAATEKELAERLRLQEEAILLAEQARQIEADRLAAEQARQIEADRLAAEQARQIEADRLAAEQARQIEADRLAAEQARQIEAERQAAEQARLLEAERLAAEQAQQLEAQRLAAEQARQRQLEQVAAEQARQAEVERVASEQARGEEVERMAEEAVQQAMLEMQRKAAEDATTSAQNSREAELSNQIEASRLAEAEQLRADRIAQEQARREQLEKARQARERSEQITLAERSAGDQSGWQEVTPTRRQENPEAQALAQREAARAQRIIEARQRQEQLALSQTPVPRQPNGNVSVQEPAPPAIKSITDADLQQVYGQFAQLQRAIQSRDIDAVLRLTEKSGTRIQQVMQMFENNVTIDARLRNVSTLDSTGEIQGTLQITRLERADGSVTGPPFNLGLVRLTSSREGGGWSRIRW